MKSILSKSLFCIPLLFISSFLATAQQPQLVVRTGHSAAVYSVAFSPDGRLIASGSPDKTVKLWDAGGGHQLRSLDNGGEVNSVAFSPDGRLIASGSYEIKLWDVATGKLLRSFEGYGFREIDSVAFSPDGKLIVGSSLGGEIRLWDIATGSQLRSLKGQLGKVSSVAFSPDGKLIVSAGEFGDIRLWDTATGKQVRSLAGHARRVNSVAFSPDGKVIASAGEFGDIRLWDVVTGTQLRSFDIGYGVNSVAFSPDGKVIAISCYDKTVKLRDAATGKQLLSLEGHAGPVYSVAFTPDGKVIASGSSDKTVKLWDAATGKQLLSLEGHAGPVESVAFSPDGKVIANGRLDGTIKLWDAATGSQLRTLEGHADKVFSVAFSPDGKMIASGSWDKTVKLWDAATGSLLRTLEETDGLFSVAFSPDGRVIAGGSHDSTVKLWDSGTGKKLRSLEGHEGSVVSVAFSPSGNVIATGDQDRIRLWDATGKQLRSFRGTGLGVHSIAFSPDGSVIAGNTGIIEFWNVATGKQLRTLPDSDGFIPISFSPDGKVIASGRFDGTIKLWDAATGSQLRSLGRHGDSITSVAFSPDGRMIASGSKDSTMKLWRTDSDKPLATLISLDKDDWVVVTPDGRFDGSPSGMKLIHYVQNNQAIPLDSFFEQFYRPKLLAQVLSGESASISRPAVDFSKAIRVPPLIRITSPKPGESFNTDAVQISVEATDQGGGVDEIRLYQNGKLVSDDTRQLVRTKATNETFDVTLVPGYNTFRATAFNKDRTESNPTEIKIELRAAEASSDLYILAIGLNEYKNARYNLNYGRADAQAFADSVEQHGHGIFKQINKHVILDDQATRKGIEEAFNRIVARAKPQDAFVFYFAGHGVMSEGSETAAAEFFLVPYDVVRLYGDDGALATNGVAARLLKDLCTKVRAQKQLIVLDACQSAGALETFALRGAAEEKAILQLARSAGVVVIAATGQDQVASEFVKLGHGVFTYALLQALSGGADGGSLPDGKITATWIVAYINDRVPELTKQYRGKTQYPNAWVRGQDFPIAIR